MAMTKLQFYFLATGCAIMVFFASLVHTIMSLNEQGSSAIAERSGFILGTLWFAVSGKVKYSIYHSRI